MLTISPQIKHTYLVVVPDKHDAVSWVDRRRTEVAFLYSHLLYKNPLDHVVTTTLNNAHFYPVTHLWTHPPSSLSVVSSPGRSLNRTAWSRGHPPVLDLYLADLRVQDDQETWCSAASIPHMLSSTWIPAILQRLSPQASCNPRILQLHPSTHHSTFTFIL